LHPSRSSFVSDVSHQHWRIEALLRPDPDGLFHHPDSHTLLAVTVPVLAIMTLRRALKGEFARHRKLAKWTWPIWMYVSVTESSCT